jgi:hypothetical protein
MPWAIKSRSDTDQVWCEIDKDGVETGVYKYEFVTDPPGTPKQVQVFKRTLPFKKLSVIAASGVGVGVAAAEIIRHFVS